MKQAMVESILANDYKKYFLSKIEFERDIISCYNSEYSFFLMNIEISNSFSTKNFEKAESLLTYKLIELFGDDNRIYKILPNDHARLIVIKYANKDKL